MDYIILAKNSIIQLGKIFEKAQPQLKKNLRLQKSTQIIKKVF